jgi:bidirectional [NiFe] hydrogenase diaphorase subunit
MIEESPTMINLTVDDRVIRPRTAAVCCRPAWLPALPFPTCAGWRRTLPADAPAACRLCFVEIDGFREPVTACTVTVENGMTVHTGTEAVRDLQKTAFKLLLSVHRVDCKHCPANKACALQDMAKFLGVGLGCKPFERVLKEPEVDVRHPVLDYYPNRCVLCGICVRTCRERHKSSLLNFAGRGFDTVVGYFDADPAGASDCGSIAAACPYGLSYRGAGGTNRCGRIAHP